MTAFIAVPGRRTPEAKGLRTEAVAALYEKAEATWGATKEAIDDLTFSGLRAKVAILLDMGSEIARYADEKSRQGR